ncbi:MULTISPECIES: hypothetical protein [Streptomyces]|uniref:Uncharacterized protein n=1 Tax=Streptomyces mordarskii TaxID=1226758 RepID=A0ABN1BVH5_9ACTN
MTVNVTYLEYPDGLDLLPFMGLHLVALFDGRPVWGGQLIAISDKAHIRKNTGEIAEFPLSGTVFKAVRETWCTRKEGGEMADKPWVHPDILPAEIVKVTDQTGEVRVGYHVREIEYRDRRIAAVCLASPLGSTAEWYVASDRCRIEPLSQEEMRQLLEERRSAAWHHGPTQTEGPER